MSIVTAIYLTVFFLSILNIVLLVEMGFRPNVYCILLMCAMVISNGGYLAISVSETVDAAIIGNCLVYLGGCYAPLFVFFIGLDLTKIRIPKLVSLLMFIYTTVVVFFTFTIGRLPIYYKSIDIERVNGYTVLVKEYGPLHNLYLIMLVFLTIASTFVCVVAFKRRYLVSYKTTIIFSAFLVVNVCVYILDRLFKIDIEWNCITFLITEIIVLFLYGRMNMYDMTYNISRAWE